MFWTNSSVVFSCLIVSPPPARQRVVVSSHSKYPFRTKQCRLPSVRLGFSIGLSKFAYGKTTIFFKISDFRPRPKVVFDVRLVFASIFISFERIESVMRRFYAKDPEKIYWVTYV